jgi:hypothetical protein
MKPRTICWTKGKQKHTEKSFSMPLFWCRRNLMAFQTSASFSPRQNINFLSVKVFEFVFESRTNLLWFTNVFRGLTELEGVKIEHKSRRVYFPSDIFSTETFSSSNSAAKHPLISDLFHVPSLSKTMKPTYLWSLFVRGIRCVADFL